MAGALDNLKTAWNGMDAKQRIRLGIAALVTVGLIWGISAYATRIRYAVLFSNLSRDDAAPIVSELRDRQVPYRLEAGGSIVEVPAERVDDLRLEMAEANLPSGGGVGFEIFDEPAFGLSDFVQNVNYRRALERELGRTIQSLDNVQSARVHLALPPEAVFADEKKEPTASVVVRLRGGSLAGNQVRAIANLVSSGVEGMQPQSVRVIDGDGNLLSGPDDPGTAALTANQLETKRTLETELRRTLVTILEPVVGKGRVRAHATVDLNLDRVQRVAESYDPDNAVVRSEQKSKTKSRDASGGGAAGTASNLPDGTGGTAAGAGATDESQSALTNFEIGKTVETVEEAVGTIGRQSVAVVVDHAPAPAIDGGGEGEVPAARPRTPEEMRQITDLVRAAVGFDEQRGDTLIVENIPFDRSTTADDAEPASTFAWRTVLQIVKYAMLPIAVLLLALLVIRPAISALREGAARGERDDDPAALPAGMPMTVAQMQAKVAQAALPAPAGSGGVLRQKLIEAASEDPQSAALILRDWLDGR